LDNFTSLETSKNLTRVLENVKDQLFESNKANKYLNETFEQYKSSKNMSELLKVVEEKLSKA